MLNGEEILSYRTNQVPLWSDSIMVDEARYIVCERIFQTVKPDIVRLIVKIYDENE
jgi:hypothetical protein